MLSRYVFCVISVLWLQASAAPAKETNDVVDSGQMSSVDVADDTKGVDKRSAGDYPVFGMNDFRDRPMVDWNMIYNNKRNAIKRQYLGQPDSRFNADLLGDKMVDWEKVFSKRKWMADESRGFGANRHMSNTDMVNWDKLFAKRADDKRAGFGNVDTGLGNGAHQELQKWAAFGRHARAAARS